MSTQPRKHFPVPTPETARYWEGCRDHKLLIQKCADCGRHQFYPRAVCSHCGSANIGWVEASGRGSVVSYTVMHRAVSKAYAADVPAVLALVRLDEDVQMMTNIIDCDAERVRTGLAVEVAFEDWSDEISMPMFRPVDTA